MPTDQPIEPELAGPVPRRVRYRDGLGAGCGLWFIRLFILPHTLVGVFLLATAVWSTGLYLAVGLFGDEFQAAVANKSERPGSKGRVTYTVEYEYTVAGRRHTGQASVSGADYQQLTVGDRFAVRALAASPESEPWVRLPGQAPLPALGGKWLMAAFWNGILSLFVWVLYVRPWRERQLVRWGRPAPGILRGATASWTKKTKTYHLTYEYAVPDDVVGGPTVRTGKMSTTRAAAAAARVGDLVTVVYDPRRPSRSVVYNYADYRVR